MSTRKQNPAEPGGSLWQRLADPAPAPRQTLTPRRIATTAVAVADAEGLDAITMRRLATELGVVPMAAYRYVSGKDDVLELMVDLAYEELHAEVGPEAGAGWRESLRDFALRTRDLVLRHPWLAQLPPQAAYALTPNKLAVADRTLAALDGTGLDHDTAMAAVRTVEAYTHGTVGPEVALRQLMAGKGWTDGDDVRSGLAPQMTYLLGTGRYPAYQRYVAAARHKDDPARRFETGLDITLDGIAATLHRP
ncbi:TetR/AcrR family transcriptional regulator [Kitasatospora phosalacinea]|uniref:TetR/AcrR family transcriptional regulator n=1 Tax=Kitasatospora phosalacinea TaxID=2065 RepID=UPI0035E118AF